jgi:tetratricopeptide (TPR) repeat protein
MRWLLPILLLLAQGVAPESFAAIDHERQYRACLALVHQKPEEALESALAWRDQGGGAPAEHCAALALLELGKHDQAALRLEALAEALGPEGKVQPAAIWAQAANIWLLGGYPDEALAAIDRGLALEPERAALLVDRARVLGELGRHADALAALDRALALDAGDDDAHAFQASALRQLGRLEEALAAADAALRLNPDNPSARLERGMARMQMADLAGARADWIETATRHPGTPAADAAQAMIEELDLKRD